MPVGRWSARLSGAGDYFPVAAAAIGEMVRQTGPCQMEGGSAGGPDPPPDSSGAGGEFSAGCWIDRGRPSPRDGAGVSHASVYAHALVAGLPPLDRQVTQEEYEAVLSWMYLNELDGFVQE